LRASLPAGAAPAIDAVLELLETDPRAPTSVTERAQAQRAHVDDSLSGLSFAELRSARSIADLGSGPGFPGLVLAAALPSAAVDLIESQRRKCAFLRRAITASGLDNVGLVCERAESWAGSEGREAYEAVAVRAVGGLATLAELASPLLADGGVLLAWKGARDPQEESEADRAAERLAMERVEIRRVSPYPGSRDRHIHLLRKNGPTPEGLPRRPGMAAKRPFGSE
jgi:16S rRNA (guanine527-N7)-methyltransferase